MSVFQSKLPRIERVFEAARANEIINHPAVRPYVAALGTGEIDLAPVAAHPDIFILLGDYGVFVLRRLMPGVLEVHTQVLPDGRGEWTDSFIQAGIRWIFTNTDAFEIVTRVPEGHLPAKATTIRSGMTYEFTPDAPYLFRGRLRPVHIYSIGLPKKANAWGWWASRRAKLSNAESNGASCMKKSPATIGTSAWRITWLSGETRGAGSRSTIDGLWRRIVRRICCRDLFRRTPFAFGSIIPS